MSNYNDQSGCQTCLQKNSYVILQNTSQFTCDLPCLCRFNVDERSSKDKMYYNWFVLNSPMDIDTQKEDVLTNPYNNISERK